MIVLLSACNTEDFPTERKGSLRFLGEIYQSSDMSTRAPEAKDIKREDFKESPNFYIEMVTDGLKKTRTYRIPQEMNGILKNYDDGSDSLNWQTATGDHTFYSWTMPWIRENEGKDAFIKNGSDGTIVSFNQNNEMYKDLTDTKYYNCNILETFVGAKAGPVNFRENGEYVPMQFRHLVSKIYIDNIRFSYLDEKGAQQYYNVKDGRMTLINMPSEGIFYREKEDGPVVIANENASKEITYQIGPGKCLYVCPDVDYSQVRFRINISSNTNDNAPGELDNGDFIGDFSSVTFERDPEDWWDEARPSTTTLYAGEMMTLNMTLRRGKGNTINVAISQWTTQNVREGSAWPHEGIYDKADLTNFYNTFRNGYAEEDEDRMYGLYGSEDEKGNKEYKLYEDGSIDHARLPMGKKYPLNGMGHNVTFSTTTSNHGNYTVAVPKCYDIFLSDTNGHTVYIDKDYKIWLVNSDGTMKATDYSLGALTGNNVKYYIDLETGKVTQSASP